MLRSLFTGISGLRNHQQGMDVVGNNLANINTVGFKASRVTFAETLAQTVQGARASGASEGARNPTQIGLGVTTSSISRNMTQGGLQATGNNFDLAIQGEGFFIVGQGSDFYYTRNGGLSLDDQYNLVTSSGDRVYGWVDTDQNGVVESTKDELQFINLDRRGDGYITNVTASATYPVSGPNQGDGSIGTIVTYPTTVGDDWRVEAVLKDSSDPTSVAFKVTGAKTGVIGTFDLGDTVDDPTLGAFAVNGGTPNPAILYLDTNGNGEALKIKAKEYGAGGNNINVEFVNNGVNQTLSVTVVGDKITVSLATDSQGTVTSTEAQVAAELQSRASSLVEVSVVTPGTTDADNNGEYEDDTVLLDTSGTPQNGGPASDVAQVPATEKYLQNGAGPHVGDYFTFSTTAPGEAVLESLAVTEDGAIMGIFDNGQTEEIARVALASVPNPAGLLSVEGGKFAESPASGSGFPPQVPGDGGTGTISAGFLEMSNVDLSREFTDMIIIQRGFQANSRIITTSDEMLQDLLALKR
ncbi:MAG: flagellar hook protein FlgE [Deferrisomatales bacterium]